MPLLLEQALFEARQGNIAVARKCFEEGALQLEESHPHPPLLQAWAIFERGQGNIQLADTLNEEYQNLFPLHD